jgi:hypothetical protein
MKSLTDSTPVPILTSAAVKLAVPRPTAVYLQLLHQLVKDSQLYQ